MRSDGARANRRPPWLRTIGLVVLLPMLAARSPFVAYRRERQYWSCREIAPVGAELPDGAEELPGALTLHEVGAHHPAVLHELGELGTSTDRAAVWLAAGHRLWVVRDDAQPVLSLWTFHGAMPTPAAPGGWLDLPPHLVHVGDTTAHPDGQHDDLAPLARAAVLRRLAAERVATCALMTTDTAQRAADAGWRVLAVVDAARFGAVRRTCRGHERPDTALSRRRVTVRPADGTAADPLVGWLHAALVPPG